MAMVRVPLRSTDRDALRADVVARLQQGQLVALPTETVYGLAVLPEQAEALARARRLLQRPAPATQAATNRQEALANLQQRTAPSFALHVASRADLRALAATVPPAIDRLIDRFWPGPLTVVLPARGPAAIGDVAVRLPAHEFTRGLIAAAGGRLFLPALHAPGAPALADPDAIAAHFGKDLDLLVDDGRTPLGSPSTVVHWRQGRLEVPREGILTADEVLHAAAELVLFVCTGNTCRSPLAAAFARQLTAKALGIAEADVLAHGFAFASAGTSTTDGLPASEGSLAAGAEAGLDLSTHQSQPLSPELVHRSSRIYCLAASHRRNTLAEAPAAGEKITLLRPDQRDVADPYGGDLRAYRKARDEIQAAVAARVAEWLPKR